MHTRRLTAAYIGRMTPDPRRFLYRPDGLDPDAALRLTADALKGCDDGELYLQYTASESFGFDDGRLKTADFNTQAGFGLRGVSGETTAFAQANELSEAAIRRAAETMAVLDPAKGAAPRPAAADQRQALHRRRSAEPDPVRPEGRALPADRRRRARARSARRAGLGDARRLVERDRDRPPRRLRRPRRPPAGPAQRPDRRRANGRRETGYHGLGGRYLYDDLFEPATWNRAIDMALAQALVNLESVAAPAGEMTVVLGPGWPGVLLHEAVGHGLEGDFNRKGTSAFSGPDRRAGGGARRHRDRRRRDRRTAAARSPSTTRARRPSATC